MKRKPAGSNFKIIKEYLSLCGPASAAEIKRATKVKGNIYVTLNKMVKDGFINRSGKLYVLQVSDPLPTLKPETRTNPGLNSNPNEPLIRTLITELEYVQDGIITLQTTKNYLVRRIEFLQNA